MGYSGLFDFRYLTFKDIVTLKDTFRKLFCYKRMYTIILITKI